MHANFSHFTTKATLNFSLFSSSKNRFSSRTEGAGGLTGRRNRDPLTQHTMQYIRAALSLLAATKHSLIYMIIGGCGARRGNKGGTRNNAQQWREGRGNRDVICSAKQKQGDIRLYVRGDSESDASTMELSTTKCRQLPIVRGDWWSGY